MRRAEWTAASIADLREIREYLVETYSTTFAQKVIDDLVLATYFLLDHPRAGPELEHGEWRKWKPRKSRHILIYEPVPDGIAIIRVRHERNDWRPVPE